MANTADRVLYLGTADGLYLGESRGSGFRSSLLGLEKTGVMRATVLIEPGPPSLPQPGPPLAKMVICR